MGGANQIFAGQADEIIFVVIGETQHFVRDDVADVDDPVPRLFHQHAIEHDRQRPIGGALRGFVDEAAGKLADLDAAAAPIVGVNTLVGNRAEHLPIFRRRVRHVLAQRGDDVDFGLVLQQVVKNFGQPARAGVHAGDIGRQQQHALRLGGNSFPRFGDRLSH